MKTGVNGEGRAHNWCCDFFRLSDIFYLSKDSLPYLIQSDHSPPGIIIYKFPKVLIIKRIGIILRGLTSLAVGPAAGFFFSIHDLVQGKKSVRNVLASVAFNGILDFYTDLYGFGYEIENENCDEEVEIAKAVACEIASENPGRFIDNVAYSRNQFGLYTPTAVEISIGDGDMEIGRVWKKSVSGIYVPPPIDTKVDVLEVRNLESRLLHSRILTGRKLGQSE